MGREVDWAAAGQIEHLFHAQDHAVWDLLDPRLARPEGGVPIRCEDGTVVAYACPAESPAAGISLHVPS